MSSLKQSITSHFLNLIKLVPKFNKCDLLLNLASFFLFLKLTECQQCFVPELNKSKVDLLRQDKTPAARVFVHQS